MSFKFFLFKPETIDIDLVESKIQVKKWVCFTTYNSYINKNLPRSLIKDKDNVLR